MVVVVWLFVVVWLLLFGCCSALVAAFSLQRVKIMSQIRSCEPLHKRLLAQTFACVEVEAEISGIVDSRDTKVPPH